MNYRTLYATVVLVGVATLNLALPISSQWILTKPPVLQKKKIIPLFLIKSMKQH